MLAAQCERLAEFIRRAFLIHFRLSLSLSLSLSLLFVEDFYTRVPAVAKSANCLRHIRRSVRPYACINTSATGRIYVIFEIGDFKKICREFPNFFT